MVKKVMGERRKEDRCPGLKWKRSVGKWRGGEQTSEVKPNVDGGRSHPGGRAKKGHHEEYV